jgi:pimeloyl-ACP methyl ester carboxylesterase
MDVMLRNRFTVAKLGWQPRWFNPDLEKWLHRIKLPSLIVWGDDDKIMPSANAALWQEWAAGRASRHGESVRASPACRAGDPRAPCPRVPGGVAS